MSDKPVRTRKPLYRILAVVLSLLLFIVTFVGSNVRIAISTEQDTDTENAAADYLINNTEYINSNVFKRTSSFLNANLSTTKLFEDLYNKASVSIGKGEFDKAGEYIESALSAYTGNDQSVTDDLLIKKACLEAMEGNYQSALETFDKLDDDIKLRRDVAQIIIYIYIDQGDLNKADDFLNEYLKNRSADYAMQAVHAEVSYLLGNYRISIDIYKLLIDRFTEDLSSRLFVRGLCYEQVDEYENALEDFKRAIETGYEDRALAYNHMALSSYMLGNYQDVIDYGHQSLSISSEQNDDAMLHNVIGLAHFQLEGYTEAIESLTASIDLDDSIEDIYYYRGVCLLVLEEFQKGVGDFTESIQRNEQTEISIYNRGLCYLLLNDIDEAKADFENVITITEDEQLITTAQEFLDMLG